MARGERPADWPPDLIGRQTCPSVSSSVTSFSATGVPSMAMLPQPDQFGVAEPVLHGKLHTRSAFFKLPSVYNFFSNMLGINMASSLDECGMMNAEC